MRISLLPGLTAILAGALLLSCGDTPSALRDGGESGGAAVAPRASANGATSLPSVRFSEIHYDNAGTDAGEAIEISGPAGTDLTGWTIVLYNGSGGGTYAPLKTLSGTVPATCGSRGVVVTTYASNGVQNGSPDGMALVDAGGNVVEFLSYEGVFAATNGPASGMLSTDIGALEDGTGPLAGSIQRDPTGAWTTGTTNTFGACNDAGAPAGEVARVDVAPATAAVAQGATTPLTATAYDAAGTVVAGVSFTWSSSAEAVATVGASTGVATGVALGTATITATAPNGVAGTATLTVTSPPPPVFGVRISEIHYDNAGADTGEGVELEGPAGADLSGWRVVLYNGGDGSSYGTTTLTGTLPVSCGTTGVLTVPTVGIQNGSPDGVALVNASGAVVEFLSYEGAFTATSGPASGTTSTDIGVSESTTDPTGLSLQRDAQGWYGPSPASPGACNTRTPPVGSIVIDELMADPLQAPGGSSWGEWFEVHNTSAAPVDLQGWTIASSGQPEHVIGRSVVVPAGGYAVLGRGDDLTLNGGVTLDYNYFNGVAATTIYLDATDVLVLRDATGATVDAVRWLNAGTMVKGATRALRDASLDNTDVDGSAWGWSTVHFGDGDLGTPGQANGTLSSTPPPVPNTISFSGRSASDPPLPVGFEAQVFGTLRDGTGSAVATTFTWSSETPSVATIDANGVMHALAAGTAVLRATAADGTTKTYSLPTTVATLSTTAQYGNNTEFGDPVDGDASDDFIVRRPEYTTSYSSIRNTPNWVAYDLDASHFGSLVDRCNCFTHDPQLPGSFAHLSTADYTGAGAYAHYGIDRGHLARSFDRTAGTLDNATTYYLSNIIPQAGKLNQGIWAVMENDLGDLARSQNKEVYIVAGVAGSLGTLKGEGKITMPAQVWKVAVVMPRDRGLADVHSPADLQVIAVIMPNDSLVSGDWHNYLTTVDAVEALSGYNLLSLLPEPLQAIVESGDNFPTANAGAAYSGAEGSAVAFSGAGSSDPDAGDVLTYAWSFGDGTTGAGAAPSHGYADNGSYTVTLVVTDRYGAADTATATVQVSNVAPALAALPDTTLLPGESYGTTGSFTDPGSDTWTATVAWGDGSAGPLALTGKTFSLAHTYTTAGNYTLAVTVQDDDAGAGTGGATVTVLSQSAGVGVLGAMVDALAAAGKLSNGGTRSLKAHLDAAAKQIELGHGSVAASQLNGFQSELEALVRTGQLPAADGDPLLAYVRRLIAALP